MQDKYAAWPGPDGLIHILPVRVVPGGKGGWANHTVCGIDFPGGECCDCGHLKVNCEDCLYGDLDDLLATFNTEKEPVTVSAPAEPATSPA